MRYFSTIFTAAAALLISTAAYAAPVPWSDGCLAQPVRAADGTVLYWNAYPAGDTCWIAPEDGDEPEIELGENGNDDGSRAGGNRSGLGDGTNPGRGAGRGHSPNAGTDNPNQA